jgi:Tol biopolymer transport system component
MSLSTGDRLGPYEILGPLGAGGMGEVFLARDTRLGRDVAIKISAQQFSERFEREARAVAALNHPNISHLYDVGPNYLVMEFIEGVSPKGPIELGEAKKMATQIADALEAAHEKGIVHRDLKPANIKVKPDGTVKVLDFGLAKNIADPISMSDGVSSGNSPTLTISSTQAGIVIGTASYMSPEQARGRSVDKRSDIWSFGVVLYEMLTGERLFKGEDTTEILASVVKDQPDLSRVPSSTRRLLSTCLEKDPKRRLRDIGDAMLLLEEPERPEAPSRRGSAPAWTAAAALGLIAIALAFVHYRERPAKPPEVARFQLRLPDKTTFSSSGNFTLSPDGRRLAFSAVDAGGLAGVWVQDLDSAEARVIPNTNTGRNPPPFFWSPDGRFIGYSEFGSKLRKVDIASGEISDICTKPGPPVGGSWNKDGVIIFGSNNTGLWRVSAGGGTPVPLTALDVSRHEREHELPSFLPDGKHFIYLSTSSAPEENGIYVGSLDEPAHAARRRILTTSFGASYVTAESGGFWMLYVLNGTLVAQAFDPEKIELSGPTYLLIDRIGTTFETGYFSAAPNSLVYRTNNSAVAERLTWFDRTGRQLEAIGEAGAIMTPRVSPDGTKVAYGKVPPNKDEEDLWILDIPRGTNTRFTFGPRSSIDPVWSPNGGEIVYASDHDGIFELYRKPTDGSKPEQLLLRSKEHKKPEGWSHDGKYLTYVSSVAGNFSSEDIWVLPMQAAGAQPFPFLKTSFDESGSQISPDGHWMLYDSNESGRYEVYVRPFPGHPENAFSGGGTIISPGGGIFPRWRRDGKEVVYPDLQYRFQSVDVTSGNPFRIGTPRELFVRPGTLSATSVTDDLQKFLFLAPVEQRVGQTFNVMVNWPSLLGGK